MGPLPHDGGCKIMLFRRHWSPCTLICQSTPSYNPIRCLPQVRRTWFLNSSIWSARGCFDEGSETTAGICSEFHTITNLELFKKSIISKIIKDKSVESNNIRSSRHGKMHLLRGFQRWAWIFACPLNLLRNWFSVLVQSINNPVVLTKSLDVFHCNHLQKHGDMYVANRQRWCWSGTLSHDQLS